MLTLCAILLLIALTRLNVSYDLAHFLPAPTTFEQRVLTGRLGAGPGAQLLFVDLHSNDAEWVNKQTRRIKTLPGVRSVWPDPDAHTLDLPPELWRHRLMLGDLPTTYEAWIEILEERAIDLTLSEALAEWIAADPALLAPGALERYFPQPAPAASSTRSILLVTTSIPSFDIGAQANLLTALRETLQNNQTSDAQPNFEILGPGAYGVTLQSAIRQESTLFSIIATVALLVLIFWWFRSPAKLLGVGLPLITGGIGGLTVVSFGFANVHGVTIAFGFTLLGVAIDYPLHLFHQKNPPAVWRILWLGVASTLISYGTFVFAGSEGLAQLGVFGVAGLAISALTAAFLAGTTSPTTPTPTSEIRLNHWLWIVTLGLCAVVLSNQSVFNDELSQLSPLPAATLARDAELRDQLQVADVRYLVAVRGENLEQVLVETERATTALARAQDQAVLGSFQAITDLLPSQQTQEHRREQLSRFDPEIFRRAATDVGFDSSAFNPFLELTVAPVARLSITSYEDESLRAAISNALYQVANDEWHSLIFLTGLRDVQAMQATLSGVTSASLIDLKATSDGLLADYRQRLLRQLSIAFGCITVLLFIAAGTLQRALWVAGTLAASIALSTTLLVVLGGALSVFNLVALTLVAGLGLDYGLFLSRDGSAPATQSVNLCALSSFSVFAILAFSTIPVLHAVGLTVAIGVAVAFALGHLGRRNGQPNPAT